MPCRNCENREVGCHATCDRYIEWKQAHIEKQRKRFAYKETEYQYMAIARERRNKKLHKKKYD